MAVSALWRVSPTPHTKFVRILLGLSSMPMLTPLSNGQSGPIFCTVHGQPRSLYAARHTCGEWPHHAVSCESRRTIPASHHVYSPLGAVYTAPRPAVRQVQQVGRLLELLVELTAVPVGSCMVRRACSCMRTDSRMPFIPEMEFCAFLQECIVCYECPRLI